MENKIEQETVAPWRELARAINQRSADILAGEDAAAAADGKDLARALARILCGESLHSAFGAPGDWGYSSRIGSALAEVYKAGYGETRIPGLAPPAALSDAGPAIEPLASGGVAAPDPDPAESQNPLLGYFLSRLRVYAARLAEDSYRDPIVGEGKHICNCCGAHTENVRDPLVHANECPVGQVIHSLEQLEKIESIPSPPQPRVRRDRSRAVESELCGLLFDARRLANNLLYSADGLTSCMLCGHTVSKDGASGHLTSCWAGSVLKRLDRMGELVEFKLPAPGTPVSASPEPKKMKGEDALFEPSKTFTERDRVSAGAAHGSGPEGPVQDGSVTVVGEPAATRGGGESLPPLTSSDPCALPGCAEGGAR